LNQVLKAEEKELLPTGTATAPTKKVSKKKTQKKKRDDSPKRNMGPMTKQEYDKKQSVIREVYDPQTGRIRMIKGDGEILESIVTKLQHQAINQTATRMDGINFQKTMGLLM